jgi:hypothetical protein
LAKTGCLDYFIAAEGVTMVQDPNSLSLWAHDRVEHARRAVTRLLDGQQDGGWPNSLQFQLDVLERKRDIQDFIEGKILIIPSRSRCCSRQDEDWTGYNTGVPMTGGFEADDETGF